MELIADILLVAGALGAGLYCFVLARRLKRFTDLEKGVGGAVSVLSAQAEELKNSLESARHASDQSGLTLLDLTQRAESVAQRLELMMASMHDVIPEDSIDENTPSAGADPADESEEESAETETNIEDFRENQKPETPAKEATKPPEGLMFFRHAPQLDEASR